MEWNGVRVCEMTKRGPILLLAVKIPIMWTPQNDLLCISDALLSTAGRIAAPFYYLKDDWNF